MKKALALLLGLSLVGPAFADSTINGLTGGSAVSDTDAFPAYQGANPATKVTGAQLKTYANTSAIDARTTTSEAIANSDQNKLVTFSNASAIAATIAQAGGGGNFAAGWAVSLRNLGAGTVTLTPATSTVDGAATVTLTTGQGLDLYSDGTNYFTQPGKGITTPGAGVATAAQAALSAAGGLTSTIGSGTKAMATSAISSAACTSAQTVTVTGTVTTDVVLIGFNGDPTAITGFVPLTAGMLTIIAYPTADTVNIKECNNTSSSITPGAHTLNVRVVR